MIMKLYMALGKVLLRHSRLLRLCFMEWIKGVWQLVLASVRHVSGTGESRLRLGWSQTHFL